MLVDPSFMTLRLLTWHPTERGLLLTAKYRREPLSHNSSYGGLRANS